MKEKGDNRPWTKVRMLQRSSTSKKKYYKAMLTCVVLFTIAPNKVLMIRKELHDNYNHLILYFKNEPNNSTALTMRVT